MKSILSLFACLLMAGCAFGANPSFQSFDTNDFLILPSISTPNKIRLNGTLGVTNLYVTNITANYITVTTNITVNGTNVAVINPTDGKYPYRSGTNSFGDGAITHIDANTAGVDEMDIGTLVVTNLMTGGVVISGTDGILTNVPAGTGVLKNDGANNLTWGAAGTTINPTDNYIPFRTNATTFLNSPWYVTGTNVATDSQIIFGPGTTNVMYRSGSDWYLTNSGPFTLHLVGNLDVPFESKIATANNGTLTLSGLNTVNIREDNSGSYVAWNYNRFWPQQAGAILGGSGDGSSNPQTPFYELNLDGQSYHYGYHSGVNNYSRLYISHTGTNGAAIYDSQSLGAGGSPVNHRFDLGATNQFAIGDGWVQLARGITKAQKAAITATNGMVVYQTDNTPGLRAYVNGSWVMISTVADP